MLTPVTIAVVVIALITPVAYLIFRKFTVTRQEIEFRAPQNGVSTIYLDIREDQVRSLRIRFADGSTSEVRRVA